MNFMLVNLSVYITKKRKNLLPKAFARHASQNSPGGRHQVHLQGNEYRRLSACMVWKK